MKKKGMFIRTLYFLGCILRSKALKMAVSVTLSKFKTVMELLNLFFSNYYAQNRKIRF